MALTGRGHVDELLFGEISRQCRTTLTSWATLEQREELRKLAAVYIARAEQIRSERAD